MYPTKPTTLGVKEVRTVSSYRRTLISSYKQNNAQLGLKDTHASLNPPPTPAPLLCMDTLASRNPQDEAAPMTVNICREKRTKEIVGNHILKVVDVTEARLVLQVTSPEIGLLLFIRRARLRAYRDSRDVR